MAIKIAIFLLTASLLVQCFHSIETKPLDDDEGKIAKQVDEILLMDKDDDESSSPLTQLKLTIVVECSPLLNFSMHEGKKMLQNVINDSETLANPTDEVETQLADFRGFVEVVEKADSVPERVKFLDLLEIAHHFKTLIDQFNNTKLEQPDAADSKSPIQVSLNKNGLPEYLVEFNKRFENFIPKIQSRIDGYLDALTPEKREGQTELNTWYAAFKAEQDIDKKREVFREFFSLKQDE